MANLPAFLRRNGESLEFALDDSEFLFIVPEVFFDSDKIATIIGNQVSMIGICNYTIIDKNGKSNGLHPFTFPTIFSCMPYQIDKKNGINLSNILKEESAANAEDYDELEYYDRQADPDLVDEDEETADYRILRFKKGDKIVVSTHVPQNIDNVEIFFNLFLLTAKIPSTIPYDKMHEYFIENAKLNAFSYGLNMQIFGILVSEIARCKNDISKPFRFSNMNDMHNYRPISIKLSPKFVSPFASITSENFDQSLMGAVTTENHRTSPLEKVLMM